MSRFAPALRDLGERLDLPQPARSRVLLEMAGDLEALHELFLARGLSEEEAVRETLAQVDLSDEALAALARIHGGWARRLLEGLAYRMGPTWTRPLLALLVLGGVVLSGAALQALPMARAAGPWLVPVACAAVAALGVAGRKAWLLLLVRDHRPRGLRTGLDAILTLTVLQPFLAFSGLSLTGVIAVRAVGREAVRAGPLTMEWLLGSLALLVMALSLALVCGLLWFLLLGKVVNIEEHEATALLAGPGSPRDPQPRGEEPCLG